MPTHRVVKIDELSQYFHLPEKAVAKQLGVCLTSLKKICRQNGITRWPYRKLKSLDKKINKIENALTNTAEDPSAMLVKWEMLKQEKKNLPFSGHSDDSDVETRKRSPAVVGRSSPVTSCSSSPASEGPKLILPDWSLCNNNSPSPPASVASGATTPNPGGPSRPLHSLLEQKLRQVGCVSTHREHLARSQANSTTSDSPRTVQLQRPEDLEIMEDDTMPLAPVSGEINMGDFYPRQESARFSARSVGAALEENFRMPALSATLTENFSFGDFFPLEEPEPIHKLTDSLFVDEFLMPPLSS